AAEAFTLNRAAVLAGAAHEIGKAILQDRLTALARVGRVDERERLVVFLTQRTNFPALERVGRGLRRRQAGRHARVAPAERQVDRQMMTAELQHPRRRYRGSPEECE